MGASVSAMIEEENRFVWGGIPNIALRRAVRREIASPSLLCRY